LCVFANESSFDITIIDPREGFTTSRDFKNANIINDWPDDYFNEFSIDQYSGLIALTHDPKLDDPALIPALESDAFYIGALGSTKTNASRMSRLREEGFSEEVLSRIHGPIGINIGSKTPAEIAVSIIAEVIQSYRKMVNADG
jgi:xanthine dehydrogenase accessory factor